MSDGAVARWLLVLNLRSLTGWLQFLGLGLWERRERADSADGSRSGRSWA